MTSMTSSGLDSIGTWLVGIASGLVLGKLELGGDATRVLSAGEAWNHRVGAVTVGAMTGPADADRGHFGVLGCRGQLLRPERGGGQDKYQGSGRRRPRWLAISTST